MKGNPMRRITVVLVCAMIAPLAFAQTKSTKTEQTTTTQPATTETVTTYTAGVVTKYQPGKTILVSSTQGPVSFAMGASGRIVNTAGNAVTSALTQGQRVRVYYTGTGEHRVVDRVVVEE
jgi:nucleoid DNA-binding protein